MEQFKLTFLQSASLAAERANHPFPQFAACEAALESGYGTSGLYIRAKNPFGMKQHSHPEFGTLTLPTKEFLHEQWVVVNAEWVLYPSLDAAFADRLATLERLRHAYPHYDAALKATDGPTFVTEVSKTWSTDPARAAKVISIFHTWTGA